MIGTGYFSMFHAEILSKLEGVQITAIHGTSLDKAEAIAAKFPHAVGYADLDKMLDASHLDAVYICVPPMAHGEIELALIKRKIPFFIEKPLSQNNDVPAKILSELKKNPLITSVGYHYRYSDSIAKLKSEVNVQNIGIVLGYYMSSMPKVPWWRNQASSGGQFIEQTTHIVDLLRYICGEIEEVSAVFGDRILAARDESVTVADVGTVSMKLHNGIVANLSNTCILPENVDKTGVTMFTNQGIVDWSPKHLKVSGIDSTTTFVDIANPYQTESEVFINAIRTGDPSGILSNYEDAYRTHKVTLAALESAMTGSSVRVK